MLIELHLLQNFAPSNLNRDDTGSPKDCTFGGYRRARISSQCLKRSVRQTMKHEALLPPEDLASRTKRVVDEAIVPRLETQGKDTAEARLVAEAALYHADLTVKEDRKTEYLLFMGARELDAVAALCVEQWDRLLADGQALRPPTTQEDDTNTEGIKPAARRARGGRDAAPKTVAKDKKLGNSIKDLLDGGKAADLALFGRMIANLPDKNVDGSCQVAHALSTHAVDVEFDFYTAVDDLKPDDTSGADMLGTIEFNSACYYRYANVDVTQLAKNLRGDRELARRTLRAFLHSSVTAIPTGKQNSMAAQNVPSLVLAVARHSGMWSLANAFTRPVDARHEGAGNLVDASVARLDDYWSRVARMYGEEQIVGKWLCTLDDTGLATLGDARVDSIGVLIEAAMETATAGVSAGTVA